MRDRNRVREKECEVPKRVCESSSDTEGKIRY